MTRFLKFGIKLLRQGLKYLRAWLRWRWRGSPRRSDDQVKHIFFKHCNPCGHYHPEIKECTLCECLVSEHSNKRNKIVYETEHCPEELW